MAKKVGRKPNNKTHKIKALSEYLFDRGHTKFAEAVKISKGHLSLILSGNKQASLQLVNRIACETEMEVTLKDLRPDLYKQILEYGNMEKEAL
jgi:transcriptional regulator with XRE-family HTH domain